MDKDDFDTGNAEDLLIRIFGPPLPSQVYIDENMYFDTRNKPKSKKRYTRKAKHLKLVVNNAKQSSILLKKKVYGEKR